MTTANSFLLTINRALSDKPSHVTVYSFQIVTQFLLQSQNMSQASALATAEVLLTTPKRL